MPRAQRADLHAPSMPTIEIMGHRGGRDLWPENSLRGFREAIALGVDLVECDVHLARDGEVVVLHDPTLERTTEGRGAVARLDGPALRTLRLKDAGGECVPTLDAVLALVAATRAGVFVEIKTDATGTPYAGLEARVLSALERHGMLARAGVLCFVPEVLEAVRRQAPAMKVLAPVFRQTAQMHGGLDRMLDRIERIDGCLVSFERGVLAAARERCLARVPAGRFCVAVTNDADELAFWMTQPVRQVCSDRPDLALAARRAAQARRDGAGR